MQEKHNKTSMDIKEITKSLLARNEQEGFLILEDYYKAKTFYDIRLKSMTSSTFVTCG